MLLIVETNHDKDFDNMYTKCGCCDYYGSMSDLIFLQFCCCKF